jgi:hypothetical protein
MWKSSDHRLHQRINKRVIFSFRFRSFALVASALLPSSLPTSWRVMSSISCPLNETVLSQVGLCKVLTHHCHLSFLISLKCNLKLKSETQLYKDGSFLHKII